MNPGYYPSLPTRPPDMARIPVEIKGEYIEDCEDIKEEDNRLTPGPSSGAIPPEFLTRPSWPPGFPSSVPPLSRLPGHQITRPPPPLAPGMMPPLATSLTPLQLIQKLSSYAANNRKRAPPTYDDTTPISPPTKRTPVSSPSFQPRIEQVMSLQSDKSQVSQSKEANNNSTVPVSPPPAPPDLGPGKSMIDCPVCGDIAVAHFHYGGMCCYSCKAFFRRVVNTNKVSFVAICGLYGVILSVACMECSRGRLPPGQSHPAQTLMMAPSLN